jgi:cobalt-zinc-cadmium efflux system outer membrane protein
MKRNLIGFSIVLFFSATLSWAEEFLSIKKALETASEANLSLKSAREELRILEGEAIVSTAFPNPEIEAQVGEIKTGSTKTGDATKEIGFDQKLETGGKRSLRKTVARADIERAKSDYRLLEIDLFRQIKEAYWALSFSHDRVQFAQENLRFQQRFLSRVQDRFQSGSAGLSDVARAKLEVARASNDLLVAQKNSRSSESNLNLLLGQDIRKSGLEVEHLKETSFDLNEDELMKKALENRPEIKSIASLEEGARAQVSLSNRLLISPDLTVGSFYQKNEREDGSDSWGAKLGVALPVWYRYRGEKMSAKARMESLKNRTEQLKQQIALDVHQSYLDLELSQEQIKLFKQAVDQATEAARLAEQRYSEGETDLLVFIQTRRDLVSATLDYIGTLKDYQASLARLEHAVGSNFLGGEAQ